MGGLVIPHPMRFADTDIATIYEKLLLARPKMLATIEQHVVVLHAREMTKLIDNDACFGSLRPLPEYIRTVHKEYDGRRKDIVRTRQRDPEVDLDCFLSIIPHAGQVYGSLYTEHGEWMRVFLSCGFAHEMPAGDTVWEDIVLRDPRKQIVPLRFDFTIDDWFHPDLAQLLVAAPSFSQRLRRRARDTIENAKMNEVCDGLSGGRPNHLNWMRAYTDTRVYANSTEGQAAIEAEMERIRPLLPKFTKEAFVI